MKKLLALLFAGVMVCSLAACGQNKVEETHESGGWSIAGSPVVTNEVKSLLEQATEGMLGAEYDPVAYIGSQTVSGTNHAVLCRITPVVPDAEAAYSVVIIYEDLQGKAEIAEILDSEAKAPAVPEGGITGGWTETESPVVTEEAKATLEKAAGNLDGAEYTPVALLATQVVSGMNYSILCEITAVSPEAGPHYSVVIVYEDTEGNAKITETYDFAADE